MGNEELDKGTVNAAYPDCQTAAVIWKGKKMAGPYLAQHQRSNNPD